VPTQSCHVAMGPGSGFGTGSPTGGGIGSGSVSGGRAGCGVGGLVGGISGSGGAGGDGGGVGWAGSPLPDSLRTMEYRGAFLVSGQARLIMAASVVLGVSNTAMSRAHGACPHSDEVANDVPRQHAWPAPTTSSRCAAVGSMLRWPGMGPAQLRIPMLRTNA
jgi:hypothetical protein